MYGDRFGSPRRDDPPYGAPWDADAPPHASDVKVAGAPVAGRPGYGTADVPPVTQVEYVAADQAPDPATDGFATAQHEGAAYLPRHGGAYETEDAYGEATVHLGDAGMPHVPRSDGGAGYVPESDGGTAYVPQSAAGAAHLPESDNRTAYLPEGDGGTAYLPQSDGVAPYVSENEVTRDDLTPVPEFGSVGRGGARGRSTRRIKILGAAVAVAVAGGGAIGGWALAAGPGQHEAANRGPVQAQGPAPLTDAQRKAIEDQRLKELKKRASRAAREDDSRPMLFAKGKPPETKKPGPPGLGDPTPVGEAQRIARAMLPDFGWKPSDQFGCLVSLWNKESGWNTHAGSPSGPYGIPQANPGTKMSSAGSDWRDSARTQIKWGLGYIRDMYHTPCGAWQHSQATGWY